MKIQIISLVLLVFSLAAPSAAEDKGENLARQAFEAYQTGDPSTCLRLYRQALDAGRKSVRSLYNAARCGALAGDPESALDLLLLAAERGYRHADHLKTDSDLESLHQSPKWAAIVAHVEANAAEYLASIHSELYDLYQQDQGDRQIQDPGPDHWQWMNERDLERRERVLELVAAGEPKAAVDFFHAAMVLQHGGHPEDYKMAHELARRAAELDPEHRNAKWLSAAAWDRYLWRTDKPQIYGTQFRSEDGKWTIEPFDREAITDEERKALNVPVVAETLKRLEAMNAEPE